MNQWKLIIPNNWMLTSTLGETFMLSHLKMDIRAGIDCTEREDKNHWIHLSVSRFGKMPSYYDLLTAKNDFIGDGYAYMVFPSKEYHVNIHKTCLHLFARQDGRPALPEFSGIVGGIRTL